MSRLTRAWYVTSLVSALAGLSVGAWLLQSEVARPLAVLVTVAGLMPIGLWRAVAPARRRTVGAVHLGCGLVLGLAGVVVLSDHGFLRLRMASLDWRILVGSARSLVPAGWVVAGVALILTGLGLVLFRRGLAVLAAVLMVLTAGYLLGGLVVEPYVFLQRHAVPLGFGSFARIGGIDLSDLAASTVLLLAALLLAVGALSPAVLRWARPGAAAPDGPPGAPADGPVRTTRRWLKPAVWSGIGVAVVVVGGLRAFAQWGPGIVVGEAFPDPALASCVATELGVAGPGAKVSQAALTGVLSLSCNSDLAVASNRAQIRNLRGAERLTNLSSLNLTNNDVSDLRPLARLDKLTSIKLTHNTVTDLTPLAGLPALTDLGLTDNAVADLGPLAHVATLRSLGLARNRITDLTPLASLTEVSTLDLSENAVSDVSPLAHLTHLSRLTVTGARISNPAPLGALPELTMLNISQNAVSDARTFTGFPALNELWLGNNPLTDVTPLADLPSLTGVDLEGLDPTTTIGIDVLQSRNIYVGGRA